MKTTLNRSDLFRFERLVSRLVKSSELPTTIAFAPCSDGLQFAAFTDAAVLTLTVPSTDTPAPFTLPWATVKEFASKKNGTIDLDVNGNTVALSWNVNGVPQHRSLQSLGLTDKRLPSMSENLIVHPITMFDVLVDAGKCVDPDNSRYSLGSICLRGSKAQIISTDGRQALIQDGFAFPWREDVLCPVSKIFGSKELRECSDTAKVGFEGHWVFFNIGDVNIWLKEIEGKFPMLDQFTKNIDHFTWLHVDPSDALFVSDRLDNLLLTAQMVPLSSTSRRRRPHRPTASFSTNSNSRPMPIWCVRCSDGTSPRWRFGNSLKPRCRRSSSIGSRLGRMNTSNGSLESFGSISIPWIVACSTIGPASVA